MMVKEFNIIIEGFKNPKEFVKIWSQQYLYLNEYKYNDFIGSVLNNKTSFVQIFQWKNGTGDVIYEKKLKVVDGFYEKLDVLKQLRKNFDWELFENEFNPTLNSPIWKIFLLHLIDPNEFPIFDQHVYRFYNFQKKGVIEEISTKPKIVFETYKQEYQPWFISVQREFQLNTKEMDQSFFSFGKFLKNLNGLPIKISN